MTFSERYGLENDVWIPGEKYNFQYSDGDDNENYILNAIQQSTDLSTGSEELFAHIKDWPSLYHLSPKRADLLRHLTPQLTHCKILEIGSGCGALTRFLAEISGEVLALEGSLRRATITRERCRDLRNVAVLCDNFDTFITDDRFDCITLIGVLEYSHLFIKGENPPLTMLKRVKQLLKPDGFIIIAIENKLGLKYFAGAAEDHLGVPFAGIENRYTNHTAITFGKEEIKRLLRQADLMDMDFYYPFPDYKLPVTVITDKGLHNSGFDIAGLLLEKHEYFQGHQHNTYFNSSLAEREIHNNQLAADLANSFLIVAKNTSSAFSADQTLLAASYSTARKKAYCKSVEFRSPDGISILIDKKRIYEASSENEELKLVLTTEPYRNGLLLQEHLLRIITVKNWTLQELMNWARKYYAVLEKTSVKIRDRFYLDGKYLDLTPFNIIIEDGGEPFIFDQEWDCGKQLPIEYVFFRGIYYSLGQIIFFSKPAEEVPRCLLELSISLFRNFTDADPVLIDEFRITETKYFSAVWQQEYKPFMPEPMRIRPFELQHEQLAGKELTIARLDQENQNLMQTVKEFKEQLESLLWVQVEKQLKDQLEKQFTEQLEKQVNDHLEQRRKEEIELAAKNHQLNEDLSRLSGELKEKEQVLQDLQFNHSLTKQQLGEINNTLVTIYHSDGWKWLNRYYNLKGKLLNENSIRYKVLKKAVNLLRGKRNNELNLPSDTADNKGSSAFPINGSPDDDQAIITGILPVFDNPEVSIIIPVYNAWQMNARCIEAIIKNTSGIAYEVIIADDCSSDRTKNIAEYFENIVHIRNEKNLGFLLNCNNAATHAKGKYLHFLNNDTQVKPGWLSSLATLMNKDETIGLAGSKLIYPDGRLQEAGGIIWNDASGWNFGNGQSPDLPEFNYVKEVDYISGASIMIRKSLWDDLGGFDANYSPAYCEDSNIAFQIREKGFKVVYQPLSEVVHYEGYSHGSETQKSEISSVKAYQRINNKKFFEKWRSVLQKDQFPNGENVFLARDRSRYKKTLLMIDHYVPQFDKDAGSRTTFQYLELFVKMGFNVKFLGENFYKHEPYTTVLQQMGIEVLYGQWYANNWQQWFKDNQQHIDYVYLNRPHVSINFIDFIRQNSKARIIYYGHDLHFLRKQRRYELEKDENLLEKAAKWKEIELYLFDKSDIILTPSIEEQKIIQSLGNNFNVQLMRPYIYKTVSAPATDFEYRKDLFFVGGFGHLPNVDGILWFVNEIWPIVRPQLPGVKFIIAGSNPPQEIKDLIADSTLVIKGYVGDDELERLYARSKMAVIPLRYGAGVKGKTVEAMRYGIPLVTTSFGVEGLPGDYSFLKVANTSAELAKVIVDTYNNEQGLEEMSRKSVEYIENNFTEEIATNIIHDVLAS
ncbi:glycosyltransferase [Terrimonas alba]|uniref:glycosyltransferase n=1 Tax=Terrimonas alba TaxID=3349636 RepID=UPI0035F3A122